MSQFQLLMGYHGQGFMSFHILKKCTKTWLLQYVQERDKMLFIKSCTIANSYIDFLNSCLCVLITYLPQQHFNETQLCLPFLQFNSIKLLALHSKVLLKKVCPPVPCNIVGITDHGVPQGSVLGSLLFPHKE